MSVRALVEGRLITYVDEVARDAWLLEETRRRYPERFAPNGELLRNYPGSSWGERLVAWQFAHAMAAAKASEDEEPEIPASTDEHATSTSDDAAAGSPRGDA